MDVMKKLVELQLQADIADNVSENTTQHREFTADFMMANGATVQEWISVKDRLPEAGKSVLTYCEANKNKYACGEYSDTYQGFFINNFWNGDITHWCYLPKPPKGE